LRISPVQRVVKPPPEYDLGIAHYFITTGSPLILAHVTRGHSFRLEPQWPSTPANHENLHRWLNGQGDLLAVITGRVFDVFDFDVQNDGRLDEFLAYAESQGHSSLDVQAISRTPSGGYHLYVNTLNKRKCPLARGIDFQGRNGIAFIPPTKKMSKKTNTSVSYSWLDFNPGGPDDGALIYRLLEAWPNHRPVLRLASSSSSSSMSTLLTRADITRYLANGIPEDLPHDNTLALVAWHLCLWHINADRAFAIWQQIVDRTAEKGGKRSYEEKDFWERHWSGAERKLRGER
jgi:hypothetical protein